MATKYHKINKLYCKDTTLSMHPTMYIHIKSNHIYSSKLPNLNTGDMYIFESMGNHGN